MAAGQWYVYLLRCQDGSLYCGITTDLERRLREHNEGPDGARYTRTRRPVTMVYSRKFPDRSQAARCEYQLKRLNREAKLALIASQEQSRPAA